MRPVANVLGLFKGNRFGKWMMGGVALAALGLPAIANAAPNSRGDWNDRYDHRDVDHRDFNHRDYGYGRDWDRDHVGFDVRIGDRPRYEDRQIRVWVPAEYKTVCEKVWVPDVYQDRTVRFFGRGEWHTRYQHVFVTPGHYEDRERQVLVCDGHYETRTERVRVADGGFNFHFGK